MGGVKGGVSSFTDLMMAKLCGFSTLRCLLTTLNVFYIVSPRVYDIMK